MSGSYYGLFRDIAKDQRIRDLEREVGEAEVYREEYRAGAVESFARLNAEIRKLEREVERLRGLYDALAVVDENDMTEQQRADRADAERFRWLVEQWDNLGNEDIYNSISLLVDVPVAEAGIDIRCAIDAARAKEGE